MVSYDFYTGDYLGTAIPETAFSGAAEQAVGVLNRFKRVYRVESTGTEAENMALCAMAECIYAARRRNGGVRSASVGNVSVSYEGGSSRALMAELYDQASIYLDIYRGVGA